MRIAACVVALGVALGAATVASAQPYPAPDTWGGDLLTRPRLTGNWGGFRDDLAAHGVVFDADLLLTPQVVATGGRDTGANFWGNAEYTLNVDTQKAKMWPGGFFKIVGESSFGDNFLRDSGAIVPVNTAGILPGPDPSSALMHATFTQFLSPKFGFTAGKIFTIDGSQGEFAGNYRTQFQNIGLTIPMSAELVPISAFGGGLIGVPRENLLLTALALDANGTPTENDLEHAFQDGTTVVASGHLGIEPFELGGHQNLTFMWSDKQRFAVDQSPSNIATLLLQERFPGLGNPGPLLERFLERFYPKLLVPARPANRESSTWGVFYNFDQYFWQPAGDAHRGVGMFFTFGASDGKANPITYTYNLGIGGNGVFDCRPRDRFGVGWARTEFSKEFLAFLRQKLDLGFAREDAVELFYNAAVTDWLDASFDLQVIAPASDKMLASSGARLERVGTTVVPGIRLYMRF